MESDGAKIQTNYILMKHYVPTHRPHRGQKVKECIATNEHMEYIVNILPITKAETILHNGFSFTVKSGDLKLFTPHKTFTSI